MTFAITTLFLILLLMQITTIILLSFSSDCAILYHTACITLYLILSAENLVYELQYNEANTKLGLAVNTA